MASSFGKIITNTYDSKQQLAPLLYVAGQRVIEIFDTLQETGEMLCQFHGQIKCPDVIEC